jgi:hypothetical protein
VANRDDPTLEAKILSAALEFAHKFTAWECVQIREAMQLDSFCLPSRLEWGEYYVASSWALYLRMSQLAGVSGDA